MSYTIEYKRQFIKSKEGITPCWLAGDNNLYEPGWGGRERRVREWCCFHNLVGVKEQDILDSVQSSLGGYGEHWIRNGKWVDDKGLIRWITSGCKSAAAIEDILEANPHLSDIHCYVSVWEDHKQRRELDYYVASTAEIDRWIRLYQDLCSDLTAKGCCVYPAISLGSEVDYRQPHINKDPSQRYILRRKGMYLTEVSGAGISWNRDIKKAAVFTDEEVAKLRADYYALRNALPINATTMDQAYNAVIIVESGPYSGQYVKSQTSTRVILTPFIDAAKHYPSEKAAKTSAGNLSQKYKSQGSFAVKIHAADN